MPLPRIQKQGATGETARLITGQFNVTTPPGVVLKQSPTGQEWRDDRPKPFPARISGNGQGSGSGAWTSGSGWVDFDHYYDWVEVVPINTGTELKFVDKENGRFGTSEVRPAVEANGIPDVEVGTYVYLYPGTIKGLEPDFYYFYVGDSFGSGSSTGHQTYYGTCPDSESFFYVQINGTTITVGEATHG